LVATPYLWIHQSEFKTSGLGTHPDNPLQVREKEYSPQAIVCGL